MEFHFDNGANYGSAVVQNLCNALYQEFINILLSRSGQAIQLHRTSHDSKDSRGKPSKLG